MMKYWRYAVAIGLLTGTFAISAITDQRKPDHLAFPLATIPGNIDGWTGADLSKLSANVEARLQATQYLSRMYTKGANQLSLLISYYAQQKAGESMHSPQACLPGAGWEPWGYARVNVPTRTGPKSVNLYSLQKDGQRVKVLYWYQSPNRILASEYAGKAALFWDAMSGGPTSGALVRLMAADKPGAVESEIEFASRVIPEVERCMRP